MFVKRLGALVAKASPSALRFGSSATSYPLPPLPRRALLYLPGHDERKANKAANLDVDSVCLDCEDAVAMSRKDDARKTIVKILNEVKFKSPDVAVRINGPRTAHAEADLDALFSSHVLPTTLVVPKVNEPADLDWLFGYIAKKCSSMKKKPTIRLVTMTESAVGLLNLRSIIEVDRQELTESGILVHEGIIFGGDDYAASIGATRSASNHELLYARECVVAHARAYNLQCIDVVNINFKNTALLAAEAREGFRMGFTGKQVIHPDQVPIVQTEFCPSPAQIKWALAVVAAGRAYAQDGTGAFSFEDKMIDLPTLKQCETIIALAPRDMLEAAAAVPPSPPAAAPAAAGTEASTSSSSTTPAAAGPGAAEVKA
eukprot:m.232963 g.232963  ORF g.232963 m.232963 type:complete len:373 (+) comp18929_c0_seq1:930-2048(+)